MVERDQEFDLRLASGRMHARQIGGPDEPLVILLHGLSAHLHGFDYLVERLAAPDRQLVALDLRGRGRSEITPAGSYGLAAHARDVLEVATLLGAERFDLVGWSMGALIGIEIAHRAPERLRRIVLIDHAGQMDGAAVARVERGLARLETVVEQPDDYVEAVRVVSGISPWNDFWDRFFRYELGPFGDGFKPTSSKVACLEDLADLQERDWHALWPGITMPALLVRCLVPIAGGFIVPESERDGLLRAAAGVQIVEVASDHYTVMQDEQAANAIREFLDRRVGDSGGRDN
ncbi:MAG: alpha/beta fold hydrolase [Thermoleophilaceae bacterium]